MKNFGTKPSSSTNVQEELKDFNKKVTHAILDAIDNVEANSEIEKIQQLEYYMNLTKIMNNYEALRPILSEFFNPKK